MFIKPGKFAKDDKIYLKCASTWATTSANNAAATGMTAPVTITEAAATCPATSIIFESNNFFFFFY